MGKIMTLELGTDNQIAPRARALRWPAVLPILLLLAVLAPWWYLYRHVEPVRPSNAAGYVSRNSDATMSKPRRDG